jgi:hypothetical protein
MQTLNLQSMQYIATSIIIKIWMMKFITVFFGIGDESFGSVLLMSGVFYDDNIEFVS